MELTLKRSVNVKEFKKLYGERVGVDIIDGIQYVNFNAVSKPFVIKKQPKHLPKLGKDKVHCVKEI
jgi:hypothetical protein